MGTPKGVRQYSLDLQSGMKMHLYSAGALPGVLNEQYIVVQLRAKVPTEMDLLTPSFKVAATLTPWEAQKMARELLRFADSCRQAGRFNVVVSERIA